MYLDSALLNYEGRSWMLPTHLYSASAVRGLYNPMQFVVRVDSSLQPLLREGRPGPYRLSEVGSVVTFAMSTYLHETIHWWQHIGSTVGLMLSLGYPGQTHINYPHLKNILSNVGPKKSLRRYYLGHASKLSKAVEREFNIVLNNYHDIEFCRRLMLYPKDAQNWISDPFFYSLGHSFYIAWLSLVLLVSRCVDPAFEAVPDCRKWDDGFEDLVDRKVEGFYSGSEIALIPLGAKEIFEGQARFSQLQFLHFASEGSLDWQEFANQGMLNGVYVAAFDTFLKILDTPRPPTINHPLVGLFLLVCDLAINPTSGFPFDIRSFESFIRDVDPGWRFYLISRTIEQRHPSLKDAILSYSNDECKDVIATLSSALSYRSVLEAAETVGQWPKRFNSFARLLEEDKKFSFSKVDLPIRLFLARFINFQQDKAQFPEYFVWPGVWMVQHDQDESAGIKMFSLQGRNAPLFQDAPDGEIRPTLLVGRPEDAIYETFDTFYPWVAAYNLVRQWIVGDGPFSMEFDWLTKKYPKEVMYRWASDIFCEFFGVRPDDFEIEIV